MDKQIITLVDNWPRWSVFRLRESPCAKGVRIIHKKIMRTLILFLAFGMSFMGQSSEKPVGGKCDRCDTMFEGMPSDLTWETTIAERQEPGERLTISGTIYKKDGKTPALGIIYYVYQTDNSGHYSPSPQQVQGKLHGHLRGWMKTGTDGRYRFNTIRPACYPSRTAPQHIHAIVKESGLSLYWIDEYLFDDDPLLTADKRNELGKRGGSGVIHLTKNARGEWIGSRDIILGLNISNY